MHAPKRSPAECSDRAHHRCRRCWLVGYLPPVRTGRGNDALKHCAAIAFSPVEAVSIRLSALRILLTFIRPRPARRSTVTLANGFEWLAGLAADAAEVREGSRKGDKPQSITV
jgi:hypothetical protein